MSIATDWGTTAEERAGDFACDALLPEARVACYRGISIEAPPDVVFRWLCQLRAAPYSYDWIDNFGRRSPRELTPRLDELAVGLRVMRIFDIASFEAPSQLTIVGNRRAGRVFGPLAVTYKVVGAGTDSRLLAKVCAAPEGLLGRVTRLLLPWGDLVMMRKQFHTLRDLAERDARRAGMG